MSAATPKRRALRNLIACMAAGTVAISLGPGGATYLWTALGLTALVFLGGLIVIQAEEVGLTGRISMGALSCLLLAPAVWTRMSRVAAAVGSVDSSSPHTMVANLPNISVTVVQNTGPLMLAAGVALIILGGRLRATFAGALLGGAIAAWAGQTVAMEINRALAAERFSDVVMLSQGLRFVGILAVLGTLAGAVLSHQRLKVVMQLRLEALRLDKIAAVREERRKEKEEAKRLEAEAEAEAEAQQTAEDEAAADVDRELTEEELADLEIIQTALYASPLLHALEDDELETISRRFRLRRFHAGEDLFLEGQTDQVMYIISRGAVQIWKPAGQEDRFELAVLTAGMLFGEMAVFEDRPRSAGATALDAVEAVALTGADFVRLGEAAPQIAVKVQRSLLDVLAQRIKQTTVNLAAVDAAAPDGAVEDDAAAEPVPVAKRDQQKAKVDDFSAALSEAPLIGGLSDGELKIISGLLQMVRFEDGDPLFQSGMYDPVVFVVNEGQVRLGQPGSEEEKWTVVEPGGCVGAAGLFDDGVRTADAKASGDVQVLMLAGKTLRLLATQQPPIALKLQGVLLELLSNQLREISAELVASDDLAELEEGPAALEADAAQAEEEEEEEEIIVDVTLEEVDPDGHLSPEWRLRQQRIARGLALVTALVAAWAASPPWLSLIRSMPSPATGIAVPVAEPGLANAQRPLNPFADGFAQMLQRKGHKIMLSQPWPCLYDGGERRDGVGTRTRQTETFAVDRGTPVVDLKPAIQEMRKRSVYRMGLVGKAIPPYGLLGEFLAWPAVQLLIDRPPRAAQWIKLHARSLEKLPLLPGTAKPGACVLLVDEEVTVDHLYSTVRSLSSVYGDPACRQAVILVLPDDGSTSNPHPGWRGCP